jgi:ABC-2 type transport system permease protein
VIAPATYAWFAEHELRLASRDALAMLTAGRRARVGALLIGIAAFVTFMHVMAWFAVKNFADAWQHPDKTTLVVVSGAALLAWSLMISQAMESVTRAFYTRSDLDLILSSPAAAERLFAVRIATLAVSVTAMALLLAGPFVNVLIVVGGPRWLAGYGVILALGALAAALSVALMVLLFRLIGPRRTRFVAQVVAAVVGAAFVIGIQVAAILSYGTLSRLAFLASQTFIDAAPDAASPLYVPARAILGDLEALAVVAALGVATLAATIAVFSSRFGEHAISAAGAAPCAMRRSRASAAFRAALPEQALRRKEWMLLRRDPWLISQTLMQILYLLPPALLLWRSFGDGSGALVLLVPVLVMAGGQLAGGLAWLAISGEDAPDLVATAPVDRRLIVQAKVEAVLMAVAIVFAPFVLALSLIAPAEALTTAVFVGIAASAATAIQLWFGAQAKRSNFRRRHTSSRIATFAEAFSSIGWAGTAALVAAGSAFAAVTAVLTLCVLGVARMVSPYRMARA